MPADGMSSLSRDGLTDIPQQVRDARVIVIGNEKGGAGKSTVSIHLSVALLCIGKKVGVIDLDVRQRSLTRYLENRTRWMQNTGAKLSMPEIVRVEASQDRDLDKAEAEESQRFLTSLARLKRESISSSSMRPAATPSCRACAHVRRHPDHAAE